jgi:hypothetical protein
MIPVVDQTYPPDFYQLSCEKGGCYTHIATKADYGKYQCTMNPLATVKYHLYNSILTLYTMIFFPNFSQISHDVYNSLVTLNIHLYNVISFL